MSTTTRAHVFVNDGIDWLDRIHRCGYLGIQGEPCSLPSTNRIHELPDTSEEQDEHRRRVGEGAEA
jgi:hypothetical protein